MNGKVGRRIYYDKMTGNVIVDTGERQGAVVATTVEQDISAYKALSERTRTSFSYIELSYGAYVQDFKECSSYRVNPSSKTIEFSYPDPNNPTSPQVFQKPLSEEIETIKQELAVTQGVIDFLLMGGM